MLKIKNVIFRFSNLENSKSFYEALLKPSLKWGDNDRWLQYDLQGLPIALASSDELEPVKQGTTVVFEVDDLEEAAATASHLGGTIVHRRDMGSHGSSIVVADPDGTLFHLWARPKTPK